MTGKRTACISSDKSKQSIFKLAGLPVLIEPYCNGTKRVLAIPTLSRRIRGRVQHVHSLQSHTARTNAELHELGMPTRIDV